ncbi:MAG: Citrate transporter [Firmicutes bacterium]|nr:Citrate transporter [Bacillota bacterium]
MWQAGVLLIFILVVFSLGKSPVFRVDRAGAAIIAGALMVDFGMLTFEEAVKAIDFRTIVILFFMMIVIANLKVAGFFELIGAFILRNVSTKKQLLLATVITSGVLSAFCINDIICLLFAPIILLVCQRSGCNPLPHLLGIAIASNVGSAATFLGNPQNILIANLSGVAFTDYSFTALPIVLIGLVVSYLVIMYGYRQQLQGRIKLTEYGKIAVHKYLVIKSLIVLVLVIIGYIAGQDLAIAASLGAAILLMTRRVEPNKIYTSIDFNLLVIFVGLFVLVGGLEHSGLMAVVVQNTVHYIDFQNQIVFAALIIVLSNIVSNVPAVLLLKFFLPATGADVLWKALALFSTFAGNLTITGSIANLIVVEIAKRQNVNIRFGDYFKVGLPITIITALLGLTILKYF